MARLLLTLPLLVAATLPAQAQRDPLKPEAMTGSNIAVAPQPVDAQRSGIIQKGMARCIYKASKVKVAALLDHSDPVMVDLPGAGIKDMDKELNMGSCMGDEMGADQSALGLRFTADWLRDLMYEETYLATNRAAPAAPAAGTPLDASFVSTGPYLARAKAIAAITDCAVLKDLAHADALLRTTPGSAAELAAAKVVAPSLAACLGDGQTTGMSAARIRSLVAYGLWNRFGRKGPVK